MKPNHVKIALIIVGVLALAGLGFGATALLTDDSTPTATGTLCARAETPPAAKAESCIAYPSGDTVAPPTTSPTTPTTTTPPPTESTTTTTPAGFDPGPTAPYPERPGCEISEKIVSCYNATWTFDAQNVDYDLVQVRIDGSATDKAKKAVLFRGGSGHIEWFRVSTELCDAGIGSLVNLTMSHARVKLLDTSGLDCHNDGFQVNCSKNVTINDSDIAGTGHSAAFIGRGADKPESCRGQDVLFDGGCWGAIHDVPGYPTRTLDVGISIAESDNSGARNVKIEPVKQHPVYVPSTPSSGGPPATNPVNEDNTVPPNTDLETCPDPIPAGY